MTTEYQALLCNNTWTLAPAPSHGHIIGCKWVFKLKYKPDGSIDRYKARLVARGFHQTHGLDYFDTFSLIVKASTVRIVLAITFSFGWTIRQLDVQNVFLNGDLCEMQEPPGFEDPQRPTHVCQLNKTLYGLKQAPRSWFLKLRTTLLN